MPNGWKVSMLDDIAYICNKSFNPLKEATTMLEHYSIPSFDELKFPTFEMSSQIKSNKFIIDSDCILISKLNPTTKRVWKPYCISTYCVCSTEFIVYKAKENKMTDYLYSVINDDRFTDFMCSHVTGSTGSRQRTTPSETLKYETVIPSDDELEKYIALVSPMYQTVRINSLENDRLKQLRDLLLPKLISGKLDISEINI